jgi:hypothetical protein
MSYGRRRRLSIPHYIRVRAAGLHGGAWANAARYRRTRLPPIQNVLLCDFESGCYSWDANPWTRSMSSYTAQLHPYTDCCRRLAHFSGKLPTNRSMLLSTTPMPISQHLYPFRKSHNHISLQWVLHVRLHWGSMLSFHV